MGRFVAIDYGTKRCGIAQSDPEKIIAYPVETVLSHELMKYLEDYMSKDRIECLVVGKPMKNDQTVSESFIHVERFVRAFKKRFPGIRVEWEDERNTSRIAVQSMVQAGAGKKERRKKENIDKVSAAVILQSFMENTNNQ